MVFHSEKTHFVEKNSFQTLAKYTNLSYQPVVTVFRNSVYAGACSRKPGNLLSENSVFEEPNIEIKISVKENAQYVSTDNAKFKTWL